MPFERELGEYFDEKNSESLKQTDEFIALAKSVEQKPFEERLRLPHFVYFEDRLEDILTYIIWNTNNEEYRGIRESAVKWFNDLYYDVRDWNEELIDFLCLYPGLRSSKNEKEYSEFIDNLRNLSYRTHFTNFQNDLCGRIIVLAKRYPIEFKWLKEKDEKGYYYLFGLILMAQEHRGILLGASSAIGNLVYRNLKTSSAEYNSFESVKWHLENYENTSRIIIHYIEKSNRSVDRIFTICKAVGVTLLSIEEYERVHVSNKNKIRKAVKILEKYYKDNPDVDIVKKGDYYFNRTFEIEQKNIINFNWLREMLSKHEIERSLDYLFQKMKDKTGINSVVLLSARLREINQQWTLGFMTMEEMRVERTKITNSVLVLVDDIERSDDSIDFM